MLKKLEIAIIICLITGLIMFNNKLGKLVTSDEIETVKKVVVIDAGHGGSDPGKIGVSGALEKDINLEIAKRIKILLEEKGISVFMTRETDEMLCEEALENNRKRADMAKRVELINEISPDMVISIHQNSYTDPEVSGAQVFYYSESEEGARMAAMMQKALTEIDNENTRKEKANDNYYLLKRTKAPTIIVECGFLSNPKEAAKLVEEEYQDMISNAIVKGIESCFGN